MLSWDLRLVVLFLGTAFAEVPDPVKDLVLIGRAQSEYSTFPVHGGISKFVSCVGVVVGNYFYTVGGYATFTVPDGFPLGGKSEGLNTLKVTASSMLILSSRHFQCQC